MDCVIQKKNCFTWTLPWDGVPPGLFMNAEDWRRTKHEILALSTEGSLWYHGSTLSIVGPGLCNADVHCQEDALPWKDCTAWEMEITSPGPAQITEWMFKSYDCENAITPELTLLGLSYFISFRLICPVLAQPVKSNMCPNKLSIPNSAFLRFFTFRIQSVGTISLVRRLYSFLHHQAHPFLVPMLFLSLAMVCGT